jgi:hypothetical protein
MKRICFIITFALIGLSSLAQLGKAKPHTLELSSGTSFDGDLLVYAEPIMSPPVFRLGAKEVPVSDVRFFRNNHGYFANLRFADQSKEGFAMRIKKGNIDLFECIDIDLYGKTELKIAGGEDETAVKKMAQGREFQYYSVNQKNIKRANYSNLVMDLQSNAESVGHLRNFRMYKWLQRGLIVAGAGLIGASIGSQGENLAFTPAMALGIVLGGSSYFCEAPKDDFMWMAVESFNGK